MSKSIVFLKGNKDDLNGFVEEFDLENVLKDGIIDCKGQAEYGFVEGYLKEKDLMYKSILDEYKIDII